MLVASDFSLPHCIDFNQVRVACFFDLYQTKHKEKMLCSKVQWPPTQYQNTFERAMRRSISILSCLTSLPYMTDKQATIVSNLRRLGFTKFNLNGVNIPIHKTKS